MCVIFKDTPVKSEHISTNVVSSNHAHGELYSIQLYLIQVYQWLATGQWFSLGTPVSSTNKTDRHDKTKILLKVSLNPNP
jgi:hypothetical protein